MELSTVETEAILELIDIYYSSTQHLQYDANYRHDFLSDILDIVMYEEYENEIDIHVFESLIEYYFYTHNIPERSIYFHNADSIYIEPVDEHIINSLLQIPKVEQRTPEWFETRHNMLSASNIYRSFKSPMTQASLIKDKSMPLIDVPVFNSTAGLYSPLSWGILFEPLTLHIYEYIHQVHVADFGCIPHPQYNYIGASPDGIVISPGEKYGRMIEIKNIYNREITGIPSDEYWTQMQFQMEVCNLPACDFVETRFCLFTTEDEYIQSNDDMTGVIIEYENTYMFFCLFDYFNDKDMLNDAVNEELSQHENCTLHWWYLDEYSCVLVQRNTQWIESILPVIYETWEKIKEQRLHPVATYAKKYKTMIILEDDTAATATTAITKGDG